VTGGVGDSFVWLPAGEVGIWVALLVWLPAGEVGIWVALCFGY
jgi:hypothetical protein